MSDKNKTCFVIMPITTPKDKLGDYQGDFEHFEHILDHLFIPAIEAAGFQPIPPVSKGSDVIQADIIKNLSSCDLVLCDMSILNPNVFFEFGIRSALDKPVALVKDNLTERIPFDTGIINYHEYNSRLDPWILKEEIPVLTEHIIDAFENSEGRNSLWKYFGITQTGEFSPGEADIGEKIDFVIKEIAGLKEKAHRSNKPADVLSWESRLAILRHTEKDLLSRNSLSKNEQKQLNDIQNQIEAVENAIAFEDMVQQLNRNSEKPNRK
jgi:hypothetical protein